MKKIYLSILISAVLCLSACSIGNDNNSGFAEKINTDQEIIADTDRTQEESIQSEEVPSGITIQEESEDQTGAQDPIVLPDQANENTGKPYYGKWKIVDFLAPGITALSTDEMEGYVNVQITYTKDSFMVDNVNFDNPIYEETILTKEDFAEGYNNQVTFESLSVSADSVTDVSVANSFAFGSMFFIADENTLYITLDGAFFKAVRQSETDIGAFELDEKGKTFLEYLCMTLEDLSSHAEMDEAFWEDFLFYSYTNASLENTEMVQIYREDLGFDETVVKVSLEEAERYAKLVFGVEMPDIKPAVGDRKEGQVSCYYQDGYYYIGASDFPDYQYSFYDCTVYDEGFDTYAIVKYRMDFENVGGKSNAGTIEFIIYPEENENGFVIASKTTERID